MIRLIWKDYKFSRWWIIINLSVIVILGVVGIYLSFYKEFPGFIFPGMAAVLMFSWSLFAGMLHYFNDDNGNFREFLNTLPIQRWKILLSKVIILSFENLIYWFLILLSLYFSLKPFSPESLELPVNITLLSYISLVLTTLTINILSVSAAAFMKEFPAKYLLCFIFVIISIIVLQFIPSPNLKIHYTDGKLYLDMGYIIKNFIVSLLILALAFFWVEKRTV